MKRSVRCSWIALPASILTVAALTTAMAQNVPSMAKPAPQTPASPTAQNAPAPAAKTDPASAAKAPAPAASPSGKPADSAAPAPATASKSERRLVVYSLSQPIEEMVARILIIIFWGDRPAAPVDKVAVGKDPSPVVIARDGAAEADLPKIGADSKKHSILVLGTAEEHREIKEVLKILDVPVLPPDNRGRPLPMASRVVACRVKAASPADPRPPPPVAPAFKQLAVYRLRHAVADQALAVVRAVYAGRPGADPLKMEASPVNNSIILLGDGEKIREVGELLRSLDSARPRESGKAAEATKRSAASNAAASATYTPKHIAATQLEMVLAKLFRETVGDDRHKLTVDAKANALTVTVAGYPVPPGEVADLLLFLDVPPLTDSDSTRARKRIPEGESGFGKGGDQRPTGFSFSTGREP